MPDYTYHPFFKPLLFRMGVEESRRLTLGLLEFQARTALGRRVFRLFGHGLSPEKLAVDIFGMRFPGPIGLGPGIDIEGTTIPVMQHLGFGFITVGPAGFDEISRSFETDPLRILERHALVHSAKAGAPSAEVIAERIRNAAELRIPIGVALRGDRLEEAIRAAEHSAAFFTLPPEAASDPERLKQLRAATKRPLLLRISPEWSDAELDKRIETAMNAGLNGGAATCGAHSPLLEDGEMDGPFLRERSLKIVARIVRKFSDRFPVIGAGGIMSPDDAVAMLDAGAKMIELYAGLVYAGPGLPGRIVHRLEHRLHHKTHKPPPAQKPTQGPFAPSAVPAQAAAVAISAQEFSGAITQKRCLLATLERAGMGWPLVAFTGVALLASGIFALILAMTVKLLPQDVEYLGMTMTDLCERNQCRIVHFMAHDRVSFGGSIMSIGIVYIWLAYGPLRRGEAWAWWALALSGLAGFGSFLTYLGYGYLDVWHGRATLALLPCFICGMFVSRAGLRGDKSIRTLLIPGAKAWFYSPAGMGRALMAFTAGGMILGGVIIMTVGMTSVFVPQDLEYMQITVEEMNRINPRLIPLIAHDRAGFGGGIASGGLAILISVWCGMRPGERWLWWAFLVSGVIGFATAIGVHPVVGYMSFIHLLPAYIGAIAFGIGMRLLYAPVCRAQSGNFPDL